MNGYIQAVTDELNPEYGLFTLAQVINGRMVGSAAEGFIEPPDDRVTAGDDGLIIRARYADEAVHIRFERWDVPPPADAWEELWTGPLRLKSALVCVTEWAEGYPPHVEFDLGQSDATWSARVATKILQVEEAGFPNAIARLELYRIQFWN